MAYMEIEQWREILESEDADRKAYDEACERRAKRIAELCEKEFWDQDQAEVDPRTMGIDSGSGDVPCATELADVEDVDEEIDFSEYCIDEDGKCCICQRDYPGYGNNAEPVAVGRCCDACNQSVVIPARAQAANDDAMSSGGIPGLNEADMREPLTRVSAALGRPASTANLTGQDSAVLAEAIRELTKFLREKKSGEPEAEKLDEAGTPTDAGWLAWVGGEKAVEGWDEQTRKSSRALFDRLVSNGELDGASGKPAAKQAKPAKWTPTGYGGKDPEASKAALEAAKKFYEQWLDDPDFRERNALKGPDGETLRKPSNPSNPNSTGKVVAGTDPNSDGAKAFAGYFDQMTPDDKEEFDVWAQKRGRRFTTRHYAPHHFDSLNKKGSLHGTGDDDDNVNPLAQHGLDQTFNADNADADMFDDPINGEPFYSQFDPDYATVSHEQIAKDVRQITDIATAWARRKGLTLEQLTKKLQDERVFEQIVNTVLDNGKKNADVQDYQLEFMFKALDDDQLAELRRELEADAGDNRLEQRFIDYIFRFGKNRKVTQEDFNFLYGIGGDQSGTSGNGTQYDDRHLGMLVAALGRYFEIDEEETSELLRVCYSQKATKSDVENGIEPRRYARHLLCRILQELYDGFAGPNMPRVTVPQSPAVGPNDGKKIQGKDWEDVKKKIAGFCWLLRLRMKPAELREVAKEIENVFEEKYGTFDAEGGMLTTGTAKVRKMVTRLSRAQNDEFQQLIDDLRNGKPMTDDAKIRVLQLDAMRFGATEQQAGEKARTAFEQAASPAAFDAKVRDTVRTFLAGGSGNVSKNTVRSAREEA